MAGANPPLQIGPYRDSFSWRRLFWSIIFLFVIGISVTFLLLIGGALDGTLNRLYPANLPSQFEGAIDLPRQIGCWRLKLNPEKFSGYVSFPEKVKVTFDWLTDQPVEIEDLDGRKFFIDPGPDSDLGLAKARSAFRFRGKGEVIICFQLKN